ncbi:MAG TPA: YdcF family protein [Magnetospirillaceae bacterium]|nr:YdcF family protein [Magnetospirillaceae bacterium]
MLKLVLIFSGIAGVFALVVMSVTSFLSIDDLAKCRMPSPLTSACAPADAIVAISGGDTPARAQEAIKLYHAGWAPVIVFSGAALDTSGPSNAAAMRSQALASGVPNSAILIEETALDTAQNASNTVRLLANARRVILVTSPYHQHRASLEFEHIFGDSVEIVNHPTPSDHTWPPTWYFTATGWWLALSEVVKTLVVAL